jgi:hypothetical protein
MDDDKLRDLQPPRSITIRLEQNPPVRTLPLITLKPEKPIQHTPLAHQVRKRIPKKPPGGNHFGNPGGKNHRSHQPTDRSPDHPPMIYFIFENIHMHLYQHD